MERREGDEAEVHGVQHELDAHEHQDGVAAQQRGDRQQHSGPHPHEREAAPVEQHRADGGSGRDPQVQGQRVVAQRLTGPAGRSEVGEGREPGDEVQGLGRPEEQAEHHQPGQVPDQEVADDQDGEEQRPDLQDPPELLIEMYYLIKTGEWDIVGCRRVDRNGESKLKSWLSNMFYKVANKISETKLVPGVRDYRMMTRQVVDAVLSMSEYSRFSKGIFSWVGFNTKYLSYSNVQRVAGKSDWTIWQLFKYAMDGISDFSQAPLNITLWLGFVSFIVSFFAIIFIVVRHWIFPQYAINGWSSLVCIILLIGGLQLLCIGLVGRYIGRIYLQVKRRPIYIIKEKK